MNYFIYTSPYQQLELDEESQKYTTISTLRAFFQYKRLIFGISSAPLVFQRTMESLLQGIPQVVVRMASWWRARQDTITWNIWRKFWLD